MRNSKVLARIRAGKAVRLAQMGYFVPAFVATCAHNGYDGIWLDLEHRAMDSREVQALLAFFHLYDIDCILRVGSRDKTQITRYLEDGAAGLIIPQVADAKEARDLVNKAKFPPVGDRGIEGGGLETNFGLDLLKTGRGALVDHALRETFLMLQIESPSALAQAEDMAAVPGVDALFFGPSDFSIRVKHEPEAARVSDETAMRQVAAACQKHGIAWGTMPQTADDLNLHKALGANIYVWGSDVRIIRSGLSQAYHDLTALLGD
jgi:2-keto-3-deoxy-L-rhamnonate aldolase RhmA